jgi:hypothetical protein
VHADLDALVTALYVRVDDLLPKRRGRGHPPRISDAELIALAVAQMFLAGCSTARRCPADSRARPPGAASWPVTLPTAGVRAIAGLSGAFGFVWGS